MQNRFKDSLIYSFLERTLFWEGFLSSKYLADNFNLTLQLSEEYLIKYRTDNFINIDKTLSSDSKLFPNDETFKFIYPENNFNNVLRTFAEFNPPFFETLPILLPVFDKDILKEVIRAMNNRDKVLIIRYQSLNYAIPEERNIVPYSIYYVRGRYHIRAYCLAKKAFRDFVLSRIISVIQVSEYKGEHISDIESNEYATVIVKPHSDLSDMQKMSTEMEFGMDEGKKEMKVKKPLLIYLLDELRVGKDYYRPPFTVLELVNSDEIASVLRTS